jgi:hypothetical protein
MLTDPALTGMSRTAFEYLVMVSEPFWDALAEAAFQRRFHRPRSYRHPQTSSVDHTHRLLAAILRRRRAVTMTFLAQLVGVNRTNLSIQYQDAKRLLDLHRILVTPIPSPAHTAAPRRSSLSSSFSTRARLRMDGTTPAGDRRSASSTPSAATSRTTSAPHG